MNKCDLCNIEFKAKQSLIRHQNKLIKCNIITKYKCNTCNKYFKTKQTLNEHNNKLCGIKVIDDINDKNKNIINILNLSITLDAKIDLLIINQKIKLTKNTIREILINQNISNLDKINLLLK